MSEFHKGSNNSDILRLESSYCLVVLKNAKEKINISVNRLIQPLKHFYCTGSGLSCFSFLIYF